MSRLAGAEHAAARERGEKVAMLWASEFPVYGRLGYGPATATAAWTFRTRQTAMVADPADEGTTELAPSNDETLETVRGVYETWRAGQPGEVWRRPITWRNDFGLTNDAWGSGWKGFVALHRDRGGAVDGYARYHAEEKWEDRSPSNRLIVDDLHGLTYTTEAALWRFIAGIDWVGTVRAEHRHPADRLPWLLTNPRAAVPDDIGDGLWIKLLDVSTALERRRYERSASIVLEVIDDDGTDARGERIERKVRVALDASPDGARATVTARSPDLTIRAGALGTAYLGGTRLSHAVLAGGVHEGRPGALADADALLATLDPPWCSTVL